MLAQHVGDCGGPPQTGGSGGGDQEDDAGLRGVAVEIGLELREGLEGERVAALATGKE
jgi:hypothetical protein